MDSVVGIALATIAGGVIGGGAISAWWLKGLKEHLRTTFATLTDLNNMGSRVNGIESVAIGARESGDDAQAHIQRLELVQSQQWERIAEHVIKPLEQISLRMEQLAQTQAVQTNTLEFFAKEIERQRSSPRRRRRQDPS